MTPKFIQPAFIKRNTPELRKKLEELGYTILFSARHGYGNGLCAWHGHVDGYQVPFKRIAGIDCEDNEQLFLALAALREDCDYMQWFCDLKQNNFTLCLDENNPKHLPRGRRGMYTEFGILHKAAPSELIEHFKEK